MAILFMVITQSAENRISTFNYLLKDNWLSSCFGAGYSVLFFFCILH